MTTCYCSCSKSSFFIKNIDLIGNFIFFPDKNEQNDTTAVNYEEAALVSSSSDYRMPLVWIDLEMTGESFLNLYIL
jgi:hypothetical protein